MTTIAPVCPISRDQPISGAPGLLLPITALVYDLPSAIRAANALALVLGPPPPTNNVYPLGQPFGHSTLAKNNNGSVGIQKRNWVENLKKRQITRKRIYKNDDKNQDIWVDVVRLMHFEMIDTVSRDTLVWDYGAMP